MTDYRLRPETGHLEVRGQPVALFQTVNSLEDLRTAIEARGPHRFAFRGYYRLENDRVDAPRALTTGLERVCAEIDDGELRYAPAREVAIVREFMRRAHHYLPDVPSSQNWFEWLALMQHHGAPTRLLDWTYSPAVAVHFALSHAWRQPGANLAVWMINTEWCLEASVTVCDAAGMPITRLRERTLRHDTEAEASRELLAGKLPASVWPINPFRLNERLTVQKGLFLAPGDVRRPFAENLTALHGHDDQANLFYFVLPRSKITSLARDLYEVNLTDATLFPGLDGFAKSLWTSARFLDGINLRTFLDL